MSLGVKFIISYWPIGLGKVYDPLLAPEPRDKVYNPLMAPEPRDNVYDPLMTHEPQDK